MGPPHEGSIRHIYIYIVLFNKIIKTMQNYNMYIGQRELRVCSSCVKPPMCVITKTSNVKQ